MFVQQTGAPKHHARQLAIKHILTPDANANVLMFPASEALCIKEAVHQKCSPDTRFHCIERDRLVLTRLQETLTTTRINHWRKLKFQTYHQAFENIDITHFPKLQAAFFDLCGPLTHANLNAIEQSATLLNQKAPAAFTFALSNRAGQLLIEMPKKRDWQTPFRRYELNTEYAYSVLQRQSETEAADNYVNTLECLSKTFNIINTFIYKDEYVDTNGDIKPKRTNMVLVTATKR